MNKQQAKRNFTNGRIHPRCPGCYQQKNMIQRMAANVNKVLVKAYECRGCGARFIAYII